MQKRIKQSKAKRGKKKPWKHIECELTAVQRRLLASTRPAEGHEKNHNAVNLDLLHFIVRIAPMLPVLIKSDLLFAEIVS